MDTGLVVYTLHAVADPPPFSEWPKPAYDLALDKSERQRTKYARVSGCCKVVTHEPTVAFWDLDKKNTKCQHTFSHPEGDEASCDVPGA